MTIERHRVLLLDTKRSNPNHYICLAIRDALSAHPDVGCVVKADYASALDLAARHGCNLFLAFDGEELDRPLCARLRARCGRSALWITEDPYELGINRANADLFDLVFTNDAACASAYGDKGRHLPLAACPALHAHEVGSEAAGHYRYDLFFAGTAWPNRVALLRRLFEGIGGLKAKIALPTNPHLPSFDLPLAPSEYSWRVPNSEFARLANRSRVVLTIHRDFSGSGGKGAAETPGPRLFETALAGGFQLVDTSIPGTEAFLAEGSEFVGFRGAAECLDKLNHYLAHPEEREAIARAAQHRVRTTHLYRHRVDTLLAAIAGPGPAPLPASAPPARPRVLMVTHNLYGVQPFGGVEVYQSLLAQRLGARYEFLYYVPARVDGRSPGNAYHVCDERHQVLETVRLGNELAPSLLSSPEHEAAFAKVLLRHGIAAVHFQHLLGHVPSLPFISRALGVASIFSLHDYYGVCEEFNLIDHRGRYCRTAERGASNCDACLLSRRAAAAGSQAKRRNFFGRALGQADILQVNARSVADIYSAVHPQLASRMRIMGVPAGANSATAAPAAAAPPLKVAILGNFTELKGARALMEIFFLMRECPVEFHIFGRLDDGHREALAAQGCRNVVVHGPYDNDDVARRLAGMAVSLHLSVWPETYCLTLSEAWQCGLIPIVADIGALGERVRDGVNGFKVPVDESGPVVDLLETLSLEPERLARMRANIDASLYVGLDEHCRWLAGCYAELVARHAPGGETEAQAWRGLTLEDCGIVLNDRAWLQSAGQRPAPLPGAAGPRITFGFLLRKSYQHVRTHGVGSMTRRAIHELRKRKWLPSR